jgi:hypothetical protein
MDAAALKISVVLCEGMADHRRDIFHAVVEGMVAGGSLDREEVGQLRRSGYTYRMILKEAVNRRILDQDQYDDIADAADSEPGQITEAAEILRLIRTNVLRSAAEGIAILVRNNTLTADIVDELHDDGSSNEQILEDLAAIQATARRRRGSGTTRRRRV